MFLWNELCPNKIRGGLQAPKQQYLPSQPLTGHPLKPSQFGSRRLLLALHPSSSCSIHGEGSDTKYDFMYLNSVMINLLLYCLLLLS